MFPHWRYVLDNVFGPVRSVCAVGATHIPTRIDEAGEPYEATAEDAAYAMFEFDGGSIVQMNSSWAVRVNRDELFELQVDGTHGSAVAGLRECKVQPAVGDARSRSGTRTCPTPSRTATSWIDVPATEPPENGFKLQWEALPAPRRARRAVPVGLRRGRARRAALRARRAVVARAALDRRAGADAVSAVALTLPRADGALETYTPTLREPLPVLGAEPRSRVCYAAAHVVVDPLAGGDPDRARRSWTGRRRSPSAGTCGRTACASRRRWTPRSAAWAWTGRRRRS